ncbi:unnamed protein product, partial [Iphiclides podalirius]
MFADGEAACRPYGEHVEFNMARRARVCAAWSLRRTDEEDAGAYGSEARRNVRSRRPGRRRSRRLPTWGLREVPPPLGHASRRHPTQRNPPLPKHTPKCAPEPPAADAPHAHLREIRSMPTYGCTSHGANIVMDGRGYIARPQAGNVSRRMRLWNGPRSLCRLSIGAWKKRLGVQRAAQESWLEFRGRRLTGAIGASARRRAAAGRRPQAERRAAGVFFRRGCTGATAAGGGRRAAGGGRRAAGAGMQQVTDSRKAAARYRAEYLRQSNAPTSAAATCDNSDAPPARAPPPLRPAPRCIPSDIDLETSRTVSPHSTRTSRALCILG